MMDKPKSMNMLSEDMDHTDHSFVPTPLPTSELSAMSQKTTKPVLEEPKGRALNFSMEDHHGGNVLSNLTSGHQDHDDIDLSDVSIGEDDEDMEMLTSKILAPTLEPKNSSMGKWSRFFLFTSFGIYKLLWTKIDLRLSVIA